MKQYGINIYNHDETKPQRKSRSKSRFPLLPNRTFSDCRCQERPTSTPIPCSISVFRMSHSELHHPSHSPNPGMSHFFTPIPHNSRPSNPSHAPPPNSQYRFRGNRKKEKKKNRKFVAMQIFPNDTIRENSYVTRTYVRIYVYTYTHIFSIRTDACNEPACTVQQTTWERESVSVSSAREISSVIKRCLLRRLCTLHTTYLRCFHYRKCIEVIDSDNGVPRVTIRTRRGWPSFFVFPKWLAATIKGGLRAWTLAFFLSGVRLSRY